MAVVYLPSRGCHDWKSRREERHRRHRLAPTLLTGARLPAASGAESGDAAQPKQNDTRLGYDRKLVYPVEGVIEARITLELDVGHVPTVGVDEIELHVAVD